ncbi:MAG: GNAT family N-acetyltransferase [Gammaproteobacteria bacterium]|nr:GNAT family N-acetyltransferase [Gammaproteobacteria bacterium]
MKINIRQITAKDSAIVKKFMDQWGGEPLVIRKKKYYPSQGMPGLFAMVDDKIIGFIIYEMQEDGFEIIVFEVFDKFQGIGTQLLDQVKKIAKKAGYQKLLVMTTNDDLDALRFYQRRGFYLTGISVNALEWSRKQKPTIPLTGDYDIPIRDEIYLEANL